MGSKKIGKKGQNNKSPVLVSRFRLTMVLIYLIIVIVALFIAMQFTNNKKMNSNSLSTKVKQSSETIFFNKQAKFHNTLINTFNSLQIDVTPIKENEVDFQSDENIIQLRVLLKDTFTVEELQNKLSSQILQFNGKLKRNNPASNGSEVIKILEILLDDRLSHRIILIKESRNEPNVKKIAIIIDDLGFSLEMLYALMEIDLPLTFSIIPHQKHSRETAQIAHEKGYEIMLHLPMEPEDYPQNNPGIGAILTSMNNKEVYDIVTEDIASLPYITGVNNHMGSKATQDYTIMSEVLKVIRENNLYFIDSQTSKKTIAYKLAQQMGVPTAIRTIFIDKIPQVNYTEKELKSLYKYANNNGYAIGIGHAYSTTIQALKKVLPQMNNSEVKLVFASELVH